MGPPCATYNRASGRRGPCNAHSVFLGSARTKARHVCAILVRDLKNKNLSRVQTDIGGSELVR